MIKNTAAKSKYDAQFTPCHQEILNDQQWAVIASFIIPSSGVGRARLCRLLPSGFPPRTTVHRWFLLLAMSGLIDWTNHRMVMADRSTWGAKRPQVLRLLTPNPSRPQKPLEFADMTEERR
jgi:hypothetical protein